MQIKLISLGLVAGLIASASARSIHDLGRRSSSLVDVSGNNVILDHTVSDSLNNLAIVDNANGLAAGVLDRGDAGHGDVGHSGYYPQSEAESEINEDLRDEFEKRSSLVDASCNKVIATDTVSDDLNNVDVQDNVNNLVAHVLGRRSSLVDASGNVVSVKKTVSNVGNGIAVTDNVNNAVAHVINTRDVPLVGGIAGGLPVVGGGGSHAASGVASKAESSSGGLLSGVSLK